MSGLWEYLLSPRFSIVDMVVGYYVGRAIWEMTARLWKKHVEAAS